jgi:predicted  nucleic acid-binding Zn-ribbon protein
MNNDEKIQTKCPKCGAEDFERVLSTTNYNIPGSSTGKTQASSTTHSCETGSCTTYDIPGPG